MSGSSGNGIDGMSDLLPLDDLVVAVVSAGSYAQFLTHLDLTKELIDRGGIVLDRLINPEAPALAPRVAPMAGHLTTDLHHIVLYPVVLQRTSNEIDDIPLGERGKSHGEPRVVLGDPMGNGVHVYLPIPDKPEHRVDLLSCRQPGHPLLGSETPYIEERSTGDVVDAIRCFAHNHRLPQHLLQHRIGLVGGIGVDPRDNRCGIKVIEHRIEGIHRRVYLLSQGLFGTIGHGVVGGKALSSLTVKRPLPTITTGEKKEEKEGESQQVRSHHVGHSCFVRDSAGL